MKRLARALLVAGFLSALGSTTAAALVPVSSPLPGYPRFGGVMLVHDGSAATKSEEKAISSALAQRASTSSPGHAGSTSSTSPDCLEEGVYPGRDLCWWGGPVLKAHTVDLIFWEGPSGHKFPTGYVEAVERYFANVAAASGSDTNVYAVGAQYGDTAGAGEYKVNFNPSADVLTDSLTPLPAEGSTSGSCEDEATKGEPCITDKALREEIKRAQLAMDAKLFNPSAWPANLEHIYFVFTPPKVGSCFYDHAEESAAGGNACAFAPGGYCGYHSDFEEAEKEVAPLYANIPDSGEVEGCDTYEHRNGAEGVDATLDVTSHEHNEIITDPLVFEGWTDGIGQEVGDKCVPPETGLYELSESYGLPLGGSSAKIVEPKPKEYELVPGTLFNQEIGTDEYWLQREWSNTAFNGEGGCVQRMLPTAFTPPSEAKATVPATFDGTPSGEAGDPAVYWVWSFGDGMQTGTPEAKTSHTYAQPGSYRVTLTAFDEYGNTNTHTATVEVGAVPPAVGPTSTPAPAAPPTNTVTVTTPPPPIMAYTATQLAQKLGLPANGKTLSGLGTISLGHAECPPACVVTLRLTATVVTRKGHRRVVKHVTIGSLRTTIAGKGTGTLALRLNATGRALLRKRKHHGLTVKLTVLVEGKEGGTWTIARMLRLTSSASVARRSSHKH